MTTDACFESLGMVRDELFRIQRKMRTMMRRDWAYSEIRHVVLADAENLHQFMINCFPELPLKERVEELLGPMVALKFDPEDEEEEICKTHTLRGSLKELGGFAMLLDPEGEKEFRVLEVREDPEDGVVVVKLAELD